MTHALYLACVGKYRTLEGTGFLQYLIGMYGTGYLQYLAYIGRYRISAVLGLY